MDFFEVLDQIVALLRIRERVTYRALKLQFHLDDEHLETLKQELIDAKRVAVDEDGKVLVWVGEGATDETGNRRSGNSETWKTKDFEPRTSKSGLSSGERRQLTVLFCDLVGSTALSTQLDPEDLREVVQAYQATAAEVIGRYEGHIAQYLGDGLLVYFGYPRAHEDDAQRAIRAGLGITHAMAQLSRLETERPSEVGRLAVRVGIHTGLVVVGEMGGGARREYLALGEVPNVAARLQALAEPGAVVISSQTERLTRGYFDTRNLGTQQLKGIDDAVGVYHVLRPNRWRSRVDVAAERSLSPFAGRARELKTLQECFEQVRVGRRTEVVFVHGEPGIGKSRLLYELKRRLEGEDLTWLEGRCISYGQSIPYLPLLDVLKANFGVDETDSEETIATKLERGVRTLGGELTAGLPYLRHLVAMTPDDAAVATLDPQVRKAQTFEALRALAVAGATIRPLVLVIEDIHWIDPLSEEWLSYLTETVHDQPLLVVITYRPDYEFRFGARPNFRHLDLQSLSPRESEAIARGLLNANAPSQELQELIISKTEGNPLFIEEVTKSLVEAGAIVRANTGYILARPLATIDVPDTVQDVIMARLDRLASEPKRVIQTAAVIGREFTVRLLERTAEVRGRVEECLRELKAAELIYERALYPELVYTFKHALTHDVAYNSLLLTRRKVLHRSVGDAIEALYPDRLAEHYETLAYHYERAAAWAKAIDYLLKSGEKALAAHAYPEALAYFQRGLQAKGDAPEDHETAALLWGLGRSQAALLDVRAAVGSMRRAFDLYLANGDIPGVAAVAQYHWPPQPSFLTGVTELIERALALVPEDSVDTARILISYATALYLERGDYDAAQRVFGRAQELARKHGERAVEMRALAAAATIDYYHARWARGAERGERALDLARQEADLLGIAAASWAAGACLTYGGELERAERCLRAGIVPAERLRDRTLIARVFCVTGFTVTQRGDLSGARQLYERSRAAAPSEPRPLTCLSIVAADTGDFDVANASIEQLQATWVEAPASDAALARCFAFAGAVVALISRDTSRLDLYVRAARQVLATPDAPECYRQEVRLALAIIAVLRRDAEAATEQYPQLHASSAGVFLWHLTVDRVLGLLARTIGDAEASAAHFEDALRFCRRGGYRPELGWTCLDYAELLLAVEDRAPTGAPADQARAAALLNEGLQVAQELGMRPLMERVLAYGQIFEE